MKNKVGIITDCICDLPRHYLSTEGVGVIYFLIETDTGIFTDTEEVNSDNIFDYISRGGQKALGMPPDVSVYIDLYKQFLVKYDSVLHISVGSKISVSYENAVTATKGLGSDAKRVHIFDSMQFSSGMGLLVMEAVDMANRGCGVEEIVAHIEKLRSRVSTSFLLYDGEYLYRSGTISKRTRNFYNLLNVHPVLTVRNGRIHKKYLLYGDFNMAARKYVHKELKSAKKLDTKRLFITCSGCPSDKIALTKTDIMQNYNYEDIIVNKASATVSTHCGPDAFGLLFLNKGKN